MGLVILLGVVATRFGYGGSGTGITLATLGWFFWLYFFLGLSEEVHNRLERLHRGRKLLLVTSVLTVPYLVYAAATSTFQALSFGLLVAYVLAPLLFLLFLSERRQRGTVGDLLAVIAIWFPIEFGWLAEVWQWPRADISNLFNALLAVSLGVFGFVSFRGLQDVGYHFAMNWRECRTALVGLLLFLAIGLPFGLASGFLALGSRLDPLSASGLAVGLILITGIPEELLFRGIIQNLLSKTLGNNALALLLASFLFGLAHLNNADWRLWVLATLAGGSYGWVYLKTRTILAPALTHAVVDALWSTYLRG